MERETLKEWEPSFWMRMLHPEISRQEHLNKLATALPMVSSERLERGADLAEAGASVLGPIKTIYDSPLLSVAQKTPGGKVGYLYDSVGPLNKSQGNLPGYREILVQDMSENPVVDWHFPSNQRVKSWARGFKPTPNEQLYYEIQKSKQAPPNAEGQALIAALNDAITSGAKEIGIATPKSVASIQGHEGVKPWMESRYGQVYPELLEEVLGKKPTLKAYERVSTGDVPRGPERPQLLDFIPEELRPINKQAQKLWDRVQWLRALSVNTPDPMLDNMISDATWNYNLFKSQNEDSIGKLLEARRNYDNAFTAYLSERNEWKKIHDKKIAPFSKNGPLEYNSFDIQGQAPLWELLHKRLRKR